MKVFRHIVLRGSDNDKTIGGKAKRPNSENGQVEVLLTNFNIVLIDIIDDIIGVETLPIATLKIYKGIPQVKHKGLNVEIYFTSGEKYLTFANRVEIHKFVKAIYELVTGKTQAERGVKKFKRGIDLVDETLEISTLDTVKGIVEKGINTFASIKGIKGNLFAFKDRKAEELESNNNARKMIAGKTDMDLDALKTLNEFLNEGIISQEEYEIKKKEILGL